MFPLTPLHEILNSFGYLAGLFQLDEMAGVLDDLLGRFANPHVDRSTMSLHVCDVGFANQDPSGRFNLREPFARGR